MSNFFDTQAIKEAIQQIGQEIYLCDMKSQAGNRLQGVPDMQRTVVKKIIGYFEPKRTSFLQLNSGQINTQNEYYAYFLPSIEKEDIKPGSFKILYNNNYYQIESLEPIIEKGRAIIYRMKLTRIPANQINLA